MRNDDMSEPPEINDGELQRLRSEVAAQERDRHDHDEREQQQDSLITRLRREAEARDDDLAALRAPGGSRA